MLNSRNRKIRMSNNQWSVGKRILALILLAIPCFTFAADPFGFDNALGTILKWLSSDTSIMVGGLGLVVAFISLIVMDLGSVMKTILKIVIGIGGAMSVGAIIAQLFGGAGALI